jgi:YD repeat-containing protein
MVAIAGILTAGGRAKSSFARAGFRAGGSNPSNDQNQNTSNTYNAAGSTNTTTNAAGSTSNTVYNAWGQPVSYTVSQSVQIGTDPTTGAPIYETYTQTETVQYDALGRILGEYESGTFPGEASTIATQHTLAYNALTGQVISDINSTTVSSTAPEGIDPARYVYAPDGNMVLREMGLFGATTPDLYTYALTDPTGTVLAIANSNGSVDERYVFDGLGNAQALQPSGAAYDPTSFTNPNRSANWQFQQQFSGSVFDTSTQTLQSEGTDYAWNIVYHGNFYNGIPGVYITPQGEFNPRQQSMLSPDLAAIQKGISAYDPTQGETGFTGWYDRNAGTIAEVSGIGLGIAAGVLTGGLADAGIAAIFGTELGFWGSLASTATSEAVGNFTAGTVQGLAGGENLSQSLEQGGISVALGLALRGGLTGAKFLPSYLSRLVAAESTVTSGGTADASQYQSLKMSLANQQAFGEAASAFNDSGGLSQSAISGSREIIAPGKLGNPNIPDGFGKYSTGTYNSPSGPFQVHFYQNPSTSEIYYGLDYKAVSNAPGGN